MKQLTNWEYELYVPFDTIEDLEKRVYDIIEELHYRADLKNCFIENNTTCDELDITW